jgi:hypothetical protein
MVFLGFHENVGSRPHLFKSRVPATSDKLYLLTTHDTFQSYSKLATEIASLNNQIVIINHENCFFAFHRYLWLYHCSADGLVSIKSRRGELREEKSVSGTN